MLKLEKSRNKEINIYVKQRTKLWSNSFVNAFSIALAVHLLAFLLIRIHPLFFKEAGILQPIEVGVDMPSADGIVAVSTDGNSVLKQLLKPPESLLSLPKVGFASLPRKQEDFYYVENLQHPFLTIEESHYLFEENKEKNLKNSVQVVVTGDLASFEIIENSDQFAFSNLKPFRAIYKVLVEGKSGQIFWHEKILSEGSNQVSGTIDNLLKNLLFKSDDHLFVTAGEIEIFYD